MPATFLVSYPGHVHPKPHQPHLLLVECPLCARDRSRTFLYLTLGSHSSSGTVSTKTRCRSRLWSLDLNHSFASMPGDFLPGVCLQSSVHCTAPLGCGRDCRFGSLHLHRKLYKGGKCKVGLDLVKSDLSSERLLVSVQKSGSWVGDLRMVCLWV